MAETPLHWPDAATLLWMGSLGALAALAHWAYFSFYLGLPEWRIRLARWRGLEPSPADIADTQGYRSRPPAAPHDGLLQSAALGLAVAIWVWSNDYSDHRAEAIRKIAEAVFFAVLFLWSVRKPRGEVGAPPIEEPEHGHKRSWGGVLFLVGFAAFLWFEPYQSAALPYLLGIVVVAGGIWLWRWVNMPPELRKPLRLPQAELPQEAVLGFLAAMAIVIFLLAIFITLAL